MQDQPRARKAWTEGDDDKLRALVAAGQNLTQIAKAMDRNVGTVHRKVRRMNLQLEKGSASADRMITYQRSVNAGRINDLAARMLDRAEELLDEFDAPQDRVERGRVAEGIDGPVAFTEPRPTIQDRARIMGSVRSSLEFAAELHRQETARADGSDLDQFLAHLAGSPQVKARIAKPETKD